MGEMKTFRVKPLKKDRTTDFMITGTTIHGEEWEEEFTTLPAAPWGALDYLQSAIGTSATGEVQINQFSSIEYICALLEPSSASRFKHLAFSKEKLIATEDISGLIDFLIEHYADRPTTPRSDSGSGRGKTKTTFADE